MKKEEAALAFGGLANSIVFDFSKFRREDNEGGLCEDFFYGRARLFHQRNR